MPCEVFAYLSHSLNDTRVACAAKRVPTVSPAHARATTPGSKPEPITVGMPAAVAISAATTFERIPPDPSGEEAEADLELAQRRRVLDHATSSAPALPARVRGVQAAVLVSSSSSSAPSSTATWAARKSLSPNEISSVVVVSFSLITGTTRQSSSFCSVRRALR